MRLLEYDDLAQGAVVAPGSALYRLGRLKAAGARLVPGLVIRSGRPEGWTEADFAHLVARLAMLPAAGGIVLQDPATDEVLESCAATPADLLAARVRTALARGPWSTLEGEGPERDFLLQCLPTDRARGTAWSQDPDARDSALVVQAFAGGRTEAWRIYRSGRGGWETRRAPTVDRPILEGDTPRDLAELAEFFQHRLGQPVAFDWIQDPGGWLHVVTARYLELDGESAPLRVERAWDQVDDGPVTLWARVDLPGVARSPHTPLSWSVWRNTLMPGWLRLAVDVPPDSVAAVHLSLWDRVQGRIYWNFNALLALPLAGWILPWIVARRHPGLARAVSRLLEEGVLQARRIPGGRARLVLPALSAQILNLFRLGGALFPSFLLRRMGAFRALVRQRALRPVGFLSGEDLLREMEETADGAHFPLARFLHVNLVGTFVLRAASRAFRPWPVARRRLAVGLGGTVSARIATEVEGLARAARPLAPLFQQERDPRRLLDLLEGAPGGRAWLGALHQFLAEHGHRCSEELELSRPRWSEDPTPLVARVRDLLAHPPEAPTSARLQRLAAEREAALDAACAAAPAWQRPWLRFLAWNVGRYLSHRDRLRDDLALALQHIRAVALELGKRLADQRLLPTPEDVFFLEYRELAALVRGPTGQGDHRAVVTRRRAELVQLENERPPGILRSDGVPVLEAAAEPVVDLDRGLPVRSVSPGQARARLRSLLEPGSGEEGVEPGCILLLPGADPALVLLLPQAAGLLLADGSPTSVLAQVARDLGIPAVIAPPAVAWDLPDGAWFELDADQGSLRRVPPPPLAGNPP